jgi:hypothetical protein
MDEVQTSSISRDCINPFNKLGENKMKLNSKVKTIIFDGGTRSKEFCSAIVPENCYLEIKKLEYNIII